MKQKKKKVKINNWIQKINKIILNQKNQTTQNGQKMKMMRAWNKKI